MDRPNWNHQLGDITKADNYINDMHSRGFDRDKFTYSITIKLYAQRGHVDMVEDEFHGTAKDGNQPDIVTYGTMLRAHVALPLGLQSVDLSCSVAGWPDRAEYCANEMVQNGGTP